MTQQQSNMLNTFFVHVFNQILAWEEQTLRKIENSDLTVRELHVIEAVSELTASLQNTMATTAKFLSISPGSLTTAVHVLVNKGYLKRSYTKKDRRVVFISLTEMGNKVNNIHKEFHKEMTQSIGEQLSEDNLDILLDSLDKISVFFARKPTT